VSAKEVEREAAVTPVAPDWGDSAWITAANAVAACQGCQSYTPLILQKGWCAVKGERTLPTATCDEWTPNREGATVAAMSVRAAEAAADANRHTCPACGQREVVLVLDFAPDGTTRDRGVCRSCDWRDA